MGDKTYNAHDDLMFQNTNTDIEIQAVTKMKALPNSKFTK